MVYLVLTVKTDNQGLTASLEPLELRGLLGRQDSLVLRELLETQDLTDSPGSRVRSETQARLGHQGLWVLLDSRDLTDNQDLTATQGRQGSPGPQDKTVLRDNKDSPDPRVSEVLQGLQGLVVLQDLSDPQATWAYQDNLVLLVNPVSLGLMDNLDNKDQLDQWVMQETQDLRELQEILDRQGKLVFQGQVVGPVIQEIRVHRALKDPSVL